MLLVKEFDVKFFLLKTQKNIFLLGMSGVGKTFWGKRIAHGLDMEFYDLDEVIEEREGKKILQIFLDNGEKYFREKESEVLKSFDNGKTIVLATGGGTPCFFDNLNWLNTHGLTIWLDEPVDRLAERLVLESDNRPLIRGMQVAELSAFLAFKLEQRKPCFSKSAIHIQSPGNLEKDILQKLENV